jgi:hypothetical protein
LAAQDGPDTPNSDDEAKEDVEADKLTGMYAPGATPNISASKISPQVASQQRALYAAQRDAALTTSSSPTMSSDFGNSIVNSPQSSRQSSRQSTPINSDNEDDMSYDQIRAANLGRKMASRGAQPPRCLSAPGTRPTKSSQKKSQPAPAPKDGTSTSRSRADVDPSHGTHRSAEASQRAPSSGTVSGQAGPRTKESTQQASRAGSLRPMGGSGSVPDVCVAQGNPPGDLSHFSLRGGFYP